jgi:pimeloyl-ACP methyl ester carboxylesterase
LLPFRAQLKVTSKKPMPRRRLPGRSADLQRLEAITVPLLVTNGDTDPMVLPRYSYLLAGLIPHARLKVYPDAAHGFLFQYHDEFAADVHAFLDS